VGGAVTVTEAVEDDEYQRFGRSSHIATLLERLRLGKKARRTGHLGMRWKLLPAGCAPIFGRRACRWSTGAWRGAGRRSFVGTRTPPGGHCACVLDERWRAVI